VDVQEINVLSNGENFVNPFSPMFFFLNKYWELLDHK